MQPFIAGITVMAAVIGSLPLFTAVKAGRFPVPDAGNPIDGLELLQVIFAPGLSIKSNTGNRVPSFMVLLVMTATDGTSFTW